MYPLDRRRVALHVYSIVGSLRKTAKLVDVCHTTVGRWIKHPGRRPYTQRRATTKAGLVGEAIRAAVACNPFVSTNKVRKLLLDTMSVSVSRELVRVVIKRQGLTRKKARFQPSRTVRRRFWPRGRGGWPKAVHLSPSTRHRSVAMGGPCTGTRLAAPSSACAAASPR